MTEAIFHGHAFVEILYEGKSLLIDPFIKDNPQCEISLEDVLKKDITAIIVTHGHADHVGDTLEIAKNTGCMVIATYELATWFVSQGLENVSKQHIGWEVQYDFGEEKWWSVKFTSAVHGWWIEWSDITGLATGVIIRIDNKSLYHAGDTALHQDMKLIGEYEAIDLAFLPIGDRFTMGVKDAVIATSFIKPKIVVPIHYNTRPLIKADATAFAREVMLENLAVPKVLNPGQAVVL